MVQHRYKATALAGEAVLEVCRDRSEHLACDGRFTAPMYTVGLVPRHPETTLCKAVSKRL